MRSFRNLKNMRELIETVSRELSADSSETGQIIAAILMRRPHELYLVNEVSNDDRMAVLSGVGNLKRGMPLEYVTGNVQFREHCLRIDSGVFIPRAETEYLVELIQKRMRKDPDKILEIGTGCGAISIGLSSIYPNASVIATDISSRAIGNAIKNVRDQGLEHRIGLIRCDTYHGIGGIFDLIVSNPPYIPRSRIDQLPRSVREYEPLLALDGGYNGAEYTQRLILEGRDFLLSDGVMALEIDEEAIEILSGFLENENIGPFSFVKDLYGQDRYLFIGALNEKS
jgi:release factor glutamine methyltransferase